MRQRFLLLQILSIVGSSTMLFSRAFTALSSRPNRAVASRWLRPNRLGPLWATSTRTNTTDDQEAAASPVKLQKTPKMRKTQLKTDLKQYRLQQSAPLKKPAYTVFANAVLDEIYARLPTTHEELLDCKGIGPKKLELYGDDILAIVAPYTNAYGGARNSQLLQGSASTSSNAPRRRIFIDANSLTGEQKRACDLLLTKDEETDLRPNGFVTGSAGTGKSYVLKYLVQELQINQRQRVGVCAPTGVAAIHVGGSTLHSFFGIGLGKGSISSLVKKVLDKKDARKRIDETDVLIIDECSMLSSDLLEVLDAVVRQVRRDGKYHHLPFGGMQVICFGDFFQLPPIAPGSNDNKPFCFESEVWEELGLTNHMIELKEVQRQKDDQNDFVSLLHKIRVGRVQQDDISRLNERCVIGPHHPLPDDGIVPTRLYSLNKDVDGENEARLQELEGEEVVCRASNSWREPMPVGTLASVKKKMADSLGMEMPDEVRLKVGAQVMLTRNKDLERNLVNGSRGVVLRFDKGRDGEGVVPVVRFDCGVVTSVAPVKTERHNPDGGPGCLVRQQVPLKLAWALTVHKSQGSTLTRALLDISSAFEYGQCYVALSRVQSLEGLWLVKHAQLWNIKVSPQVLDFYKRNRASRDNDQ